MTPAILLYVLTKKEIHRLWRLLVPTLLLGLSPLAVLAISEKVFVFPLWMAALMVQGIGAGACLVLLAAHATADELREGTFDFLLRLPVFPVLILLSRLLVILLPLGMMVLCDVFLVQLLAGGLGEMEHAIRVTTVAVCSLLGLACAVSGLLAALLTSPTAAFAGTLVSMSLGIAFLVQWISMPLSDQHSGAGEEVLSRIATCSEGVSLCAAIFWATYLLLFLRWERRVTRLLALPRLPALLIEFLRYPLGGARSERRSHSPLLSLIRKDFDRSKAVTCAAFCLVLAPCGLLATGMNYLWEDMLLAIALSGAALGFAAALLPSVALSEKEEFLDVLPVRRSTVEFSRLAVQLGSLFTPYAITGIMLAVIWGAFKEGLGLPRKYEDVNPAVVFNALGSAALLVFSAAYVLPRSLHGRLFFSLISFLAVYTIFYRAIDVSHTNRLPLPDEILSLPALAALHSVTRVFLTLSAVLLVLGYASKVLRPSLRRGLGWARKAT